MVRILVIDDEGLRAADVEARLRQCGYEVAGTAASGEKALALAGELRPDVALMDLGLAGQMDAITAATEIRQCFRIPVVFLAASSDEVALEKARLAGPGGYVFEPIEDRALKASIELAFDKHQAERQVHRLARLYATLSDVNQATVRARSCEELFAQVCQILTSRGGYRMAWVGLAEQDDARSVRPVAQAGFEAGYLDTLRLTWADTERGRGPTGTAIRTRQPVIARNLATDPAFAPWRQDALQRGYAASAALPLTHDDCVLGALMVYAAEPDTFDPGEVELLTELAGDIAYGITTLRTNAEHARTEAALLASERKYRELVEHANSIILRWNCEGRITFMNEFGQRFFGYSAEEILGRHVMDTIVPSTDSSGRDLGQLMDQICADPIAFEQNVNENVRRNGEHVWIAWTNRIARDAQGRVAEILSVGTDITERKRAQDALRRSEEQFRLIMENLADLVVLLDLDGHRLYNSPSYQSILGDLEKLRGSSSFNEVHPEDKLRVQQAFADTVRTGVGRRLEYRLVDQNGKPRRIESQGSVIHDAQGRVAQVLVVSRDVTQRWQADEAIRELNATLDRRVAERTAELAVALDRAQAADHLKSAFLATMSHELRTPLNSIIGFTGIILQGLAGPLNAEQRKQLDMVRNSSRHLLALVNDVLDISKIEAGQIEIATESFDLRAAIQKVAQAVTPLADKKHLPLVVRVAPEVGPITSDRRRVEQILLNLLSNAFKFTERGHVTLAAEMVSGVLHISVTDTGLGIKPEDRGKLFQPFRQLDTGLTRQHDGTGLGLAICKRLVERLGGAISVESQCGVGSTFWFTLPAGGEERPEA